MEVKATNFYLSKGTQMQELKRAYLLHKRGAVRRGIEFYFTLEEWCNWWEVNLGPDWLSKRGRKKNQYVMARNGDVGPYHPDNVKCKTQSENAREQTKKVRVSKLSGDDVRKIYLSRATYSKLARTFGVKTDAIEDIKWKHCWRHITDLLD